MQNKLDGSVFDRAIHVPLATGTVVLHVIGLGLLIQDSKHSKHARVIIPIFNIATMYDCIMSTVVELSLLYNYN
jgi:hypothetical protein